MIEIPFTQYLRPDGRKKDVSVRRPPEICEAAQKILSRGLQFECEVLTTSDVSLTVTHPDHGDIAIEVVPNGPQVPDAVDRLVYSALEWEEPS